MRKRTAAGGVIVVALVVGGWLSGLFRGLGLGPGGGAGDADPRNMHTSLSDNQDARPQPAESLAAADVVEVLIDGDAYAVQQTRDRRSVFQPAGIDEIVTLALAAPGNSQGVRVRIRRRGTALPSAEQLLENALIEAGLRRTDIHQVDEIAP